MTMIFKKTNELEIDIDEFLDLLARGAYLFGQGIGYYLHQQMEEFERVEADIRIVESKADELRRSVELRLYKEVLIPESRGDVLGLMESSDKVLNALMETVVEFSVERPLIHPELVEIFTDLSKCTVSSVEALASAVRSYFRDAVSVHDHINKSLFYEKESDQLSEKIKRRVFQMKDLDLTQKIQTRYFSYHIEEIADSAEDVCDRLSIAVIKRSW